MDPILAISAVGGALKIIDSITGQWDRLFKNKAENTTQEHSVKTHQIAPDQIVVRRDNQDIDTITVNDFAKLDQNSLALIKAIEDSMQRQYNLWVAVYPMRNASPDPLVNAQVHARLMDIAREMCGELGKLFKYLESMGKYLEDHYSHIRFLCSDLPPQH